MGLFYCLIQLNILIVNDILMRSDIQRVNFYIALSTFFPQNWCLLSYKDSWNIVFEEDVDLQEFNDIKYDGWCDGFGLNPFREKVDHYYDFEFFDQYLPKYF